MTAVLNALAPRKQPVQARASATLALLHTAAIQVLGSEGLGGCTTTRVAERAGVSVGSLYQYYPNRDALLAAVLDRHLDAVAQAIEDVCRDNRGRSVAELAAPLVSSFLAVKFGDADASKALYAAAGERGGPAKVAEVQMRMTSAITEMLAAAPDGRFGDPGLVAAVAFNAMVGPVRAVLEGQMSQDTLPRLEVELSRLVGAYLERSLLRTRPPAQAHRQA